MTLGILVKPVFIASILVFSIAGLGIILQDVSAEHGEDPGITTAVVVGSNTLSFRDITNTAPQTSTLTLDESKVKKKGFYTINLEELDANLDVTAIDTVIATASSTTSELVMESASVTLTESDVNTGIFSGKLIFGDETVGNTLHVEKGDVVTVNYEEESQGVGRFQAELEVTAAGNVEFTDVLVPADTGSNIIPRSHAVNLKLLDGATLDVSAGNAPVITLSYAHLDLGVNVADDLSMYYNPGGCDFCGFAGWQEIRDPQTAIAASHDPIAKTITSDIATSPYGFTGNQIFGLVFGQSPTEGQFMLAFDKGSVGGGGGGGLVRPGFVVNTLAGAGVIASLFGKGGTFSDFGASSNSGPAKPIVTTGTVSILSDESIGFVQQGVTSDSDSDSTSNSLDSTQNIGVGEDRTFQYNVYENKGTDNIIHSTMYFFDAQMMDENDRIDVSKSETYIRFEKGNPVQVVDPYGYFEKAGFEISKIDTFNSALKYDITFGKSMPESHIVLRTWDGDRYTSDTFYPNAVVVSADEEPLTQSEFEISPFLDTQYESQLTEEETLTQIEIAKPSILDTKTEVTITKTGFPGIPLWVKNNAMWWHEKQIDDTDFVAGIQYMINEELITIHETQIKSSTTKEIPQWVSNVAGYWSNDQIPDDQFVQAMQWMVSNGVMEV